MRSSVRQRNWQRVESGLRLRGAISPRRIMDVRGRRQRLSAASCRQIVCSCSAARGAFPGYEIAEIRAAAYWSVSGVVPLVAQGSVLPARPGAVCRCATAERPRLRSARRPHDIGRSNRCRSYVTGRTPVGPVTIGFATTKHGCSHLWFSLGRPVWQGTLLDSALFR